MTCMAYVHKRKKNSAAKKNSRILSPNLCNPPPRFPFLSHTGLSCYVRLVLIYIAQASLKLITILLPQPPENRITHLHPYVGVNMFSILILNLPPGGAREVAQR